MQYVPDDLASRPPSPGLNSTLQINVPSGILPKGNTLPTLGEALTPTTIPWFKDSPSGAAKQHAVPFVNSTRARGVPLPRSCMISLTTPVSERSDASGNLTGAIRRKLREVNCDPPLPRLCTRICLPKKLQIRNDISRSLIRDRRGDYGYLR